MACWGWTTQRRARARWTNARLSS